MLIGQQTNAGRYAHVHSTPVLLPLSRPVLTGLRLLLALRTFVHCAVEGLVDCLVLWLVTDTSLPAPGFAFGLIASADKASVTSRIGLLVWAVLTFPGIYEAHAIYKSYCGMLAHQVMTQYTMLAHPMVTLYTLLAHPMMTQYILLAHPMVTQYTLLAHPMMTVHNAGAPEGDKVNTAGTTNDDTVHITGTPGVDTVNTASTSGDTVHVTGTPGDYTVHTAGPLGDDAVHTAGTPCDDSTHCWHTR